MAAMDSSASGRRPAHVMNGRQLAYALLFITPALWSVNYLVARWAPGVIAPHALALGRWIVAAMVLGAFCAAELRDKRGAIRAEWKQLLVLGTLGMWICGAFVYIGGQSTAALNIGLIYSACPIGIAVGSVLL
jgi:drug/metabolite transporter (DMT)-like permease